MIAIIDYGMGNLRSVEKGFLKSGVDVKVTNSPEVVLKADGVVLPGVGAFRDCMSELKSLGLIAAVKEIIKKGRPYLGICLGLQVLFSESEEFGTCAGLDIFKGKVVRFEFDKPGLNSPARPENKRPADCKLKIPQMGWNRINIKN